MILSQKEFLRCCKRKPKKELNIKKEITKKLKAKKELGISKEVKHVVTSFPQQPDISKMGKKDKSSQLPRKRKRVNSEIDEELEDFDVKTLSMEHILQCVATVFHLIQEQLENKNVLVEETQPIFMQIDSVKIPKVPCRQLRILLPNSIVSDSDEVALFVCDLQKGKRKDYEPTVEHYKNLLEQHECTRINEIIPINRVKTEFDQYELKRKLVASYDSFLVDGRIAAHMSHLLGKAFCKKRKMPVSIRMDSKDLKHEIDYALRKSSMHIHPNGDTHLIQVGNTSMTEHEILENILAVCENLSINYPGGWSNIRALRLKGATTLALPFYLTLKHRNVVKPIVIHPKRPKAYHDVKGDLSTYVNDMQITVKPDGDIVFID